MSEAEKREVAAAAYYYRTSNFLAGYGSEDIRKFDALLNIMLLEGFIHPHLVGWMDAWNFGVKQAQKREA